ncbi:MAG: cytochrome c biogenesis protein CcdA [Candidatus Firestonebacteria bacterium]
MITGIFEKVNSLFNSGTAPAILASFIWGILSIILSPCHLSSIPLIIGFINGQGRISTKRAFSVSLLFAVGILVTIAIIGGITAAAGRMLGDIGKWGHYLVAAIFFIVGLILLDVIPLPFSGPGQIEMKKKGLITAFILGLVFGIAIGPCTFAYMAPMLGVAFKLTTTNPLYGITLLMAYGVGHCTVIVFAGTFSEIVQHFLNWNERSKGVIIIKKICGALVILGGIHLVLTTF